MRLAVVAIALTALIALAVAPAAGAAPPCIETAEYPVATTADDGGASGKLSLRDAVAAADTDGKQSTINVPAGTYQLSMLAELPVEDDCAFFLTGAGARSTTIDGVAFDRVLDFQNSSLSTVSGVTITGGYAHDDSGGGILVGGSSPVRLERVSVRGNRATNFGGGISAAAPLTVVESTISGNTASPLDDPSGFGPAGGGVYVGSPSTTTFINSTVSGNSVNSGSGGDGVGGGVANYGTVEFRHTTLAGNSATGGGGNLRIGTNAKTLNSLIALGAPGNCTGGTLTSDSSGDESLADDATCPGLPSGGDVGKLGPLLNNGGPTDTRAVLPGNPAFGGGEFACPFDPLPTTDQRGVTRPQGDCTVGAYEPTRTPSLGLTMSRTPNPVAQHALPGLKYVITVRSSGPAFDATQPIVKDVLPAGVTVLQKTASQGSCSGAKTITCALGTLANGKTAKVTIRVRVDATTRSVSNTASVSSPRLDTSVDDDVVTLKTTVNPTDLDDLVVGTAKGQTLCGLLGSDTIKGLAGPDVLYGDNCGRKNGPGGADKLIGGKGGDTLVGGGGKNTYKGGPGDDRVRAVNGKADQIDCGGGSKDFAKADKADSVKHCETVKRV